MEAFRNRNELLLLTSNLMRNNLELARRIAHLEHCFDTSQMTHTRRQESLVTVTMSTHDDASVRMQETSDALSLFPYDAAADFEQGKPTASSNEHQESTRTAVNFEFERVLFSSRVYYGTKSHTSDVSFRSSVGLSHAWTALSDISLSNISSISVVALPLTSKDVSNRHHYAFRQATARAEHWSGQDFTPSRPMSIEASTERSLKHMVYPDARSVYQHPTTITLMINGSTSSTQLDFVGQVCHLLGSSYLPDPTDAESLQFVDSLTRASLTDELSSQVIKQAPLPGPLLMSESRPSTTRQCPWE